MTDEALKPCPFCGGKSEFIRIDDDNDPCFGGVVVSCLGCGASSKVYFPLKEDVKPLLLEQWNRRAVLAEQAEPVACPICRGTGREGIPGAHCTFCDGTGKFMRGKVAAAPKSTP